MILLEQSYALCAWSSRGFCTGTLRAYRLDHRLLDPGEREAL